MSRRLFLSIFALMVVLSSFKALAQENPSALR